MNYSMLSGNTLKLIAALSMVIDHIGMIIFPSVSVLRIIGRIAFPIFSYMIFEGTKYTKSMIKYFLKLFILGIITSAVYYLFTKELYFNVLITFSFSVALIGLIKYAYTAKNLYVPLLIPISFSIMYCVTKIINIDYGFWGIVLPVFPTILYLLNKNFGLQLFSFSVGLFILSFYMGGVQMYSILSIPFLALYNGKRGFYLPRYSFYIFYPLHIAVIWIINLIL